MRPLHTWPSRTSTPTARPIILHHASAPPWTPLGGWEGRGERERGEREAQTTTTQVASGGGGEASKRSAILRRVTELEDFLPFPFAVAGDATVGTRGAARIGLSFGCGASGGRHLRRMFEWNDDQQQVRCRGNPSFPLLFLAVVSCRGCCGGWICFAVRARVPREASLYVVVW